MELGILIRIIGTMALKSQFSYSARLLSVEVSHSDHLDPACPSKSELQLV